MKKLFMFIVIAMVFQACGGSSTGSDGTSTTPAVGAVNLEGMELVDLPGGYQNVVRKGEGGKLLEQGVLQNGKRNGIWIVYHANKPMPQSVANFVDDQYSGPYMQYSIGGQVELICSYKANLLDGDFTKFKSGRITEQGSYKNGQYHGIYTKFYPNKDIPQQISNYDNGQLHGIAKYFNEAGDLIMEYEYNHGEKLRGGIVEKKPTE